MSNSSSSTEFFNNPKSGDARAPRMPDRPSAELLQSPHSENPFQSFLSYGQIGPVQMFEVAILPTVYPYVRMVTTVADSRWNNIALSTRLFNVETPADYQRWFYHAAHCYGAPWICRKTFLPTEFISHDDGVDRTKLLHHMFAGGSKDERIQQGASQPALMAEARRRGFIYLQAPLMAHLHWWMDASQWRDMIALDPSLNGVGMRTGPRGSSTIMPKIHDGRSFLIKLGDWSKHGTTPAVPPNVRSRIP